MSGGLLLDVTRLVSRLPRKGLTGVDRVELAWLDWALRQGPSAHFLLRTRFGFLLFGPAGGARLRAMINQPDLGMPRARGWTAPRHPAETVLRPLAIDRASRAGLRGLVARHLGVGDLYLNVGHSNLTGHGLRALGAAGLRRVVLVHDTIPLDHPDWARRDTVPKFRRKMRAVAHYADRVIHTAEATRTTNEAQFRALGRVPDGVVAPLGVRLAAPDPAALPPELARLQAPYLCVGTLEPRKNHALLLQIWTALADDLGPEATPHLVLVGKRGWLDPSALAALEASPLYGSRIHEYGGLGDGALAALYQRAAALLMPSRAEGFGLPPLEAASLGCPVLAADLPVYREVLRANAVYLDPLSMYSWKAIIKQQLAGLDPFPKPGAIVLPDWEDHFARALAAAGPQD